jgi:hypothetical protein
MLPERLQHAANPHRADAQFVAQILELQSAALNALAHELGNLASPIGIHARTLASEPSMDIIRFTAGALGRASARLGDLTVIARALSAPELDRERSLMPARLNDGLRSVLPAVEGVLPRHAALTAEIDDPLEWSVDSIPRLCWLLLSSARLLAESAPHATRFTMSARARTPCVVLAVDEGTGEERDGRDGPDVAEATSRWLALLEHLAAGRATIDIVRSAARTECRVGIGKPHAHDG